jgi:hypothetical protein
MLSSDCRTRVLQYDARVLPDCCTSSYRAMMPSSLVDPIDSCARVCSSMCRPSPRFSLQSSLSLRPLLAAVETLVVWEHSAVSTPAA